MQQFHPVHGGQPQSGMIPVPPQHHQPGLGGRPPPPPMVHQQRPVSMVAPMSLPPQMQQRPMPPAGASFPAHPPHPPRHVIPSHFQRPVVVSDIRDEGVTEDDIREDLSDYIILRFEKIEPNDEYDSDGEKVRASWDNCVRRRIAGVDKADARKEIRRLSKEDAKRGKTLLEKQNALGPKQQDQLERAQRDLSLDEHDGRFHTVLAQIDHTLKPFVDRHEKVYVRRPNTKKKIRQKKRYERTSITAYFRRCPKPDQSPSVLARDIQAERQREFEMMRMRQHHHQSQEQTKHQQQMMAPLHRPHAVQQHPHPGPMFGPQAAAPMFGPGPTQGMQVMRQGQGQGMPMHQHHQPHHPGGGGHGPTRPCTPIRVEVDHRKQHHHHGNGQHSRSSDSSSDYSDYGSGSELGSGSTVVTEPSRSSGSYKGRRQQHYEHHKRRGSGSRALRYLEEPRNFGVDVAHRPHHPGRRHSLIEAPSYILTTGSGARVPIIQVPAPPREAAVVPAENIDQIRADAYRAGRSDEKAAFRHALDDTADSLNDLAAAAAARRYQPRYAPRPEIIHNDGLGGGVSPTRIRHVTSSEVGRQLGDEFRRLGIGSGSGSSGGRGAQYYHDDLGGGGYVHVDSAQRLREARAREEQEDIMRAQMDEDALWRRRREEKSPESSVNPFDPLPRRRANGMYDVDRDYRR
ncbi:hypothetical protein Daus18300_003251 [Diaporthe australafricana]|uniref:Uncharacterized protein n=1 Tax=Diaporthe australafricana TaxID=127596 RepID=A0ABR3XGV1_9PEZI